jgi:hypothetical protein
LLSSSYYLSPSFLSFLLTPSLPPFSQSSPQYRGRRERASEKDGEGERGSEEEDGEEGGERMTERKEGER